MNAEDKLNKEIAKRVRATREEVGLSQEELGTKLGMSKVGYGHYERGTHPVPIWALFQLSRILGRPVEYFLGLDTELSADEGRVLALYRQAVEKGQGYLALGLLQTIAEQ